MTSPRFTFRSFFLLASLSLMLGGCQRWSSYETAFPTTSVSDQSGDAPRAALSGTRVDVVLLDAMTSEDEPRRAPTFVTQQDILDVEGKVLAPAGSPVTVRVEQLHRRMLGRPGQVRIWLVGVITPEGDLVPISGHARAYGRSNEALAQTPTPGNPRRTWVFDILRMFIVGGRARLPEGLVIPGVVGDV